MTPGHHHVVVDRTRDSEAECDTCTLLHPANAGPLTLYGPRILIIRSLLRVFKLLVRHKSIPGTRLLRPVEFVPASQGHCAEAGSCCEEGKIRGGLW